MGPNNKPVSLQGINFCLSKRASPGRIFLQLTPLAVRMKASKLGLEVNLHSLAEEVLGRG